MGKSNGLVALNLCTMLWGTQHAVIKSLVTASALPFLINAIRFSIASVVTSAVRVVILVRVTRKLPDTAAFDRSLLVAAAELSCWQTLGFSLQVVGLRYTTADRSAFILYLNAPLVPLIALLMGAHGIGIRTWVCAFTAVAGTLMLVNDGGSPNVGDVWSLGAALASASYIVRLSHAGRAHDASLLSATTLGLTSVVCWVITAAAAQDAGLALWTEVVHMFAVHAGPILYLAVVISALCSFLQAYGQQTVPSTDAVVIYTLDPVYAVICAWVLLGERLQMLGWVGVIVVVGANLLRQLPWQGIAPTLLTPDALDLPADERSDAKCAPLLSTPPRSGLPSHYPRKTLRSWMSDFHLAGRIWRAV